MTDYLTTLARRTLGLIPVIQPLIASIFETWQVNYDYSLTESTELASESAANSEVMHLPSSPEASLTTSRLMPLVPQGDFPEAISRLPYRLTSTHPPELHQPTESGNQITTIPSTITQTAFSVSPTPDPQPQGRSQSVVDSQPDVTEAKVLPSPESINIDSQLVINNQQTPTQIVKPEIQTIQNPKSKIQNIQTALPSSSGDRQSDLLSQSVVDNQPSTTQTFIPENKINTEIKNQTITTSKQIPAQTTTPQIQAIQNPKSKIQNPQGRSQFVVDSQPDVTEAKVLPSPNSINIDNQLVINNQQTPTQIVKPEIQTIQNPKSEIQHIQTALPSSSGDRQSDLLSQSVVDNQPSTTQTFIPENQINTEIKNQTVTISKQIPAQTTTPQIQAIQNPKSKIQNPQGRSQSVVDLQPDVTEAKVLPSPNSINIDNQLAINNQQTPTQIVKPEIQTIQNPKSKIQNIQTALPSSSGDRQSDLLSQSVVNSQPSTTQTFIPENQINTEIKNQTITTSKQIPAQTTILPQSIQPQIQAVIPTSQPQGRSQFLADSQNDATKAKVFLTQEGDNQLVINNQQTPTQIVKPQIQTIQNPKSKIQNPQTIQVNIGRIEVRFSKPPASPTPQKTSTKKNQSVSLQDYLKQRQGGNS